MDPDHFFPDTYEFSRQRFRGDLTLVQHGWPGAELENHALSGTSEDLTIDWIQANPRADKERLLVITTGEHGIEAFLGSAVLQLFLEEYLPRLDPETTGLLLIHAINPWGMKHLRRVNRGNVDLNRNFGWEPGAFNLSVNPDYDRINPLLNPRQPLTRLAANNTLLNLRLLASALRLGTRRFMAATLMGQYRYPRGVWYGGDSPQEETAAVSELYQAVLPQYNQVVHLDMHTGFGPREPMTVVTSWMEAAESKALVEEFHYPRVVKSAPGEFYSIQGDMIDYVYALMRKEAPDRPLFAASFEFGTLGETLTASLRSLRTMIYENQVYWHGAATSELKTEVEDEFREMYYPAWDFWRSQALEDSRKAFEGILTARGYLAARSPGGSGQDQV